MPSHKDITRASIGILQRYQEQKAMDDSETDYSGMTSALRNEIEKIRNDSNDIVNKAHSIPTVSESELYESELLTLERVTDIRIVHAHCKHCGAELKSNGQKIYNPFTGEKICKHVCKCGAEYNFENTYPRVAYFNEQGEEVTTF